MYIGLIYLQTGMCLVVLVAPTVLLCETAWRIMYEGFTDRQRSLMIANVLLPIVLAIAAHFLALSTFTAHATAGYVIAGALLVVFNVLTCLYWLVRGVVVVVWRLQANVRRWIYPVSVQDNNAPRVRIEQ